MKDEDYQDGYKDGVSFAEQDFHRWRGKEGPPFPWPKVASQVSGFVDDCFLRMNIAFHKGMIQNALEKGLNPDYIAIPRAYLKGLEDAYRTRLTDLLYKGK